MARDESSSEETGSRSQKVRFWLSEIEAAKRREKDYRKQGVRVREIYDGTKSDTTPFNVLFSNTETISPSLYSAVPRPVVQRRFKDDAPAAEAAAKAAQRMLEFQLDTNVDGYETFNDGMKAIVLDALLPGRGVACVKYDYEAKGDVLKSQLICLESKSWNRVLFGYARKWSKVPWLAFEIDVDKEEATALFGKEKAAKMRYSTDAEDTENEHGGKRNRDEESMGERKLARVYQIWDKAGGRMVRYVSSDYPWGYLKEEPDSLGLTGFYPTPKPLQFIEKTDDLVPTSMYTLYENQARELNRITTRINKLVDAMKARGLYDATLDGDLQNLMEAEENELIPAGKELGAVSEKGLNAAIWFMPLDVLQKTLQQLYVSREQTKQVIYEIIGISDILRGTSKASETLGAQQIKNQWGSLRLKPKQAEVQRYARDLLRIMLEIAAKHLTEDQWAEMTGLPYLTQQQAQQLVATAAQVKQAAMRGDQQAAQQYKQMVEQSKQTVTWEAVLGTLKNDLQRAFKVDIETNSTVEPEAVEDQKNVTELMTALGQFLQSVGPLVLNGSMPFEVAQSMMLAISRRFRFGSEIEQYLRQMMPPKPPEGDGAGDGGAAVAAEGKAQKAEVQRAADKLEFDKQVKSLQEQLEQAKRINEDLKRKADLDIRELSVQTRETRLAEKQKLAQQQIDGQKKAAIGEIATKQKLAAADGKVRDAKAKATSASSASSGSPAPQGATAEAPEPMEAEDGMQNEKIDGIMQVIQQLTQVVAQQGEQMGALLKSVRAPRRKTPIRGKDGKIAQVMEEIVDEGGDAPQTIQ